MPQTMKHENAQLKCDKLFQLKCIGTKNVENLIGEVVCSINNIHCMQRNCDKCRQKRVNFSEVGDDKNTHSTCWSEWNAEKVIFESDGKQKESRIVKKQLKFGSVEELKDKFSVELSSVLCPHVYNIRHQFNAYRQLKQSLSSAEAVLHIDFSENYKCQHANEVQSCHFGGGHSQATLHTGVCYTAAGYFSFATVSDCLRHDAVAVWAHLDPVLLYLKEQHPSVDCVHFFSDGPSSQYRNKTNFFLLSRRIFIYGLKCATWNMFESGHGKGAPDGIGGALKRQADDIINHGGDITDAKQLFTTLTANTSVKLFLVTRDNISQLDPSVNAESISSVPGTMKLHQISTYKSGEVSYRNLSCFCSHPDPCDCYDVRVRQFASSTDNSIAVEQNVESVSVETSAASTLTSADYSDGVTPAEIPDVVNHRIETQKFYRRSAAVRSISASKGTARPQRQRRVPSKYDN
jgi:hypothetical protein